MMIMKTPTENKRKNIFLRENDNVDMDDVMNEENTLSNFNHDMDDENEEKKLEEGDDEHDRDLIPLINMKEYPSALPTTNRNLQCRLDRPPYSSQPRKRDACMLRIKAKKRCFFYGSVSLLLLMGAFLAFTVNDEISTTQQSKENNEASKSKVVVVNQSTASSEIENIFDSSVSIITTATSKPPTVQSHTMTAGRPSLDDDKIYGLDDLRVLPIQFACPHALSKSSIQSLSSSSSSSSLEGVGIMEKKHQFEWYEKDSINLIANVRNMTQYLNVFREADFDNWGHTYNEVKLGMHDWKLQHFRSLLSSDKRHPNRTVYESACGTGLNLLMTLEILQEVSSTSHIIAYGNDVQSASISFARRIARSSQFPGQIGVICTAGSTHIDFVPSNSFDIAYTGYISPLADPLLIAETLSIDNDADVYSQYTEFCEDAIKNSASGLELTVDRAEEAQTKQEEWYAAWVQELIRIAKPGAKVIVEQISYPLCEALYDWGGVSPDFWDRAVVKYRWPVNTSSIVFQDDTIFRHRYHMMMRKLAIQ